VRVILYYLEGVREPERFAAACRAATRAGKRVVLVNVGTSPGGRAAVTLHTGAPPQEPGAFEAVIASTGAVSAETLDEAVEAAEFLSYAEPPHGGRIAVMVFSGGLKGLVADCAARVGATLAPLAPHTLTQLEALVETGGSVGNPLDFGPPIGGTFDAYLDCLRALRADPNVDVVLLQDELLRAAGSRGKEENFARLDQLAVEEPGVPFGMFSMISHSVTDYGRALRATFPHLPFLQEPAKALRIVSRIGTATVS
jgi:acyl-CoA synthetase (NDP forming)